MKWPEDPNAPKIDKKSCVHILDSWNDAVVFIGAGNYEKVNAQIIQKAIKQEIENIKVRRDRNSSIELAKVEFAQYYNHEGFKISKHINQKKQKGIDLAKKKNRKAMAKQSKKQNRR